MTFHLMNPNEPNLGLLACFWPVVLRDCIYRPCPAERPTPLAVLPNLKQIHPAALLSIAATVTAALASFYFDHGHTAIALVFLTANAILAALLPNKR